MVVRPLQSPFKDDVMGGIKTIELNDLGVTEMPSGVTKCNDTSQ